MPSSPRSSVNSVLSKGTVFFWFALFRLAHKLPKAPAHGAHDFPLWHVIHHHFAAWKEAWHMATNS
jgi:hypothetical protein